MAITCLWHLQVKDLIHYAVESIGFILRLNAWEDRMVCQFILKIVAVFILAVLSMTLLKQGSLHAYKCSTCPKWIARVGVFDASVCEHHS